MESLFLSSFKEFIQDRLIGGKVSLNDFDCFEVKGLDAFDFLQGQLTSDISICTKKNRVILCSRIDRVGKLKSYFYIYKHEDSFRLLIPQMLSLATILDLEKYIIAEDVIIAKIELSHSFVFGESVTTSLMGKSAEIFNEEGFLVFDSKSLMLKDCPSFSSSNLETLKFLNFWIADNNKYFLDKFCWEAPVASSLSITKGCYLGQESVNKIMSGRGANYFPGFIISKKIEVPGSQINFKNEKVGEIISRKFFDEFKVYSCIIKREFRINNKSFDFEVDGVQLPEAKFQQFPLYDLNSNLGKSVYLQDLGQKRFIGDEVDSAISYLKRSLLFNNQNVDALESLGIILSRVEKYVEALDCFDKLIKLSPESPLAHTNKSIIFAKMGKIEEAESEKEKAVLLEFQNNNALNKITRDEIGKDEQRIKMFLEVLEIDCEDSFANYSIGEIYFRRKNFSEAKRYLSNVLRLKNNDHLALLLMGKILIETNKSIEGLEYIRKAVAAAALKGDLKIANEAQSFL